MTLLLALLALTEPGTVAVTTVVVSAVIGPLVVGWAAARARRIEQSLGSPNGHGDISTMLSTIIDTQLAMSTQMVSLLEGQVTQDARLSAIEARIGGNDGRIIELRGALDSHGRQLVEIVARVSVLEAVCERIRDTDEHTAVAVDGIATQLGTDQRHTDRRSPDGS